MSGLSMPECSCWRFTWWGCLECKGNTLTIKLSNIEDDDYDRLWKLYVDLCPQWSEDTLCNAQWAHCTLYTLHCTHCTCALCTLHCSLYTVHTAPVHCALYTVHTVHCTLCTVHTVHCTGTCAEENTHTHTHDKNSWPPQLKPASHNGNQQ